MAGIYGKGLYSTIYNKMGIYGSGLYSNSGASAPTKRTDSRLGEFGQANPDAEEENEEENEEATPTSEAPTPEVEPEASPSFFARDTKGVPNWLLGLFFLGFVLAYKRNKRKAKNALSTASK